MSGHRPPLGGTRQSRRGKVPDERHAGPYSLRLRPQRAGFSAPRPTSVRRDTSLLGRLHVSGPGLAAGPGPGFLGAGAGDRVGDDLEGALRQAGAAQRDVADGVVAQCQWLPAWVSGSAISCAARGNGLTRRSRDVRSRVRVRDPGGMRFQADGTGRSGSFPSQSLAACRSATCVFRMNSVSLWTSRVRPSSGAQW
jgi:hypothetical protein